MLNAPTLWPRCLLVAVAVSACDDDHASIEPTPNPACVVAADCAPPNVCEAGSCVTPCKTPAACDAPLYCVAGYCRPYECDSDSQCPESAAQCLTPDLSTDCQGERALGLCAEGRCVRIPDDSGCAGVWHGCPNNLRAIACGASAVQTAPSCPSQCLSALDCLEGYECLEGACQSPVGTPPILGNAPDQWLKVGVAMTPLALANYALATDGDAIDGYALTSGNLPAGLTLDATSGMIQGTPQNAGTSTANWVAWDDDGYATLPDAISFTIAPAEVTTTWQGPEVQVVWVNGFPRLRINGVDELPFFFTANTQGGLQDNWEAFDAEVSFAEQFGVPILSLCLGSWGYSDTEPLTPEMRTLFDRTLAHHPNAYLLPRVYFHHYGDPSQVLMTLTDEASHHVFNALTETWVADRQRALALLLTALDKAYPGRILGVHLSYMQTGEWFFPEPEAGRFADYSSGTAAGFCAALGLNPGDPDCALPTPSERNTATVGNSFLSAESPTALRSIRMNQYLSHQTTFAIRALAQTAKQVSGGRALTLAFYGYLYALADVRLTGSGHLALGELLQEPALDGITAPYQYTASTRQMGGNFLPHGPMDSPALHGKLWIHEDDTETHLCSDWQWLSCDQAQSLTDSCFFLRRNAYAAALHKNGLYNFDLLLGGWYGIPSEPTSNDLWLNINLVRGRIGAMTDLPGPHSMQPQVAIFIDDLSPAYLPLAGPAGGHGEFNFATNMQPVEALAGIGAPVRHYLLSDLLLPSFDASQIRLAVFPNAFRVTSALANAIHTKLEGAGRTLVYLYAPGLLNDSEVATTAAMTSLTGIQLVRGTGPASLTTEFADAGPIPAIRAQAGSRYGVTYGVDPWFYSDDANVTVLGRYFGRGQAALVLREFGDYRVLFSGSPELPAAIYQGLAEYAGVHRYATTLGDTLEAQGNTLLLHVNQGGSRTLTLPFVAASVREDTLDQVRVVCSSCSQFTTTTLDAGGSALYVVQ